jgi:membrane protein DedA with SNARE-associated domain
VLASIVDVGHLVEVAGYPLLFLLVAAESAGVPLPGETALITGAVLAGQGELELPFVIGTAAAAAIVGDNIGYVIGQHGGRWLLERPGPFHRQRLEVLATGEPFFERHGPKAVFLGRFLLGLRTWASWLAGATRMRWRTFALYNMLGGVCWACAIGIAAYYVGHSAENALSIFGIFGLIAVAAAIVGFYVAHRMHKRRVAEEAARRDTRGEGDGGSARVEGDGGSSAAAAAVGHISAVGGEE